MRYSKSQQEVILQKIKEYVISMFYNKQDYKRCSKFDQSNFKLIDKCVLQFIRIFMLSLLGLMFLSSFTVNGSIMWFFYYETFWGLMFTTLSIISSMMAVKHQKW